MPVQVIMPQLGESVVEGTIGRWLVAEGQPVKEFDPLLTVTTDKVDTEIPAPASGVLLEIHVPEGQTVAAGTLLALIGEAGEQAAGGSRPGGGQAHPPAVTPLAQRIADEHGLDLGRVAGSGPAGRITKEDVEAHLAAGSAGGQTAVEPRAGGRARPADASRHSLGFISPAVARLAAEFDVDLGEVIGTGEGGRVTKKDVMAYVAAPAPRGAAASAAAGGTPAELPPWEQPGSGSLFKPSEEVGSAAEPAAPAAAQPPVAAAVPVSADDEVVPLSAMRKAIAQHMVMSKQTSAHVTTIMEADMTRVARSREKLRGEFERQGTKLTFTPFFIQAIVAGLTAVPAANSTFQEDRLLVHRQMHVGMAVAIPDGLIVPVVRAANEKSLLGLARTVNDLAERARAKRLAPAEVQGATFTLTNHGTSGSLFATPIINQPQAGILGVGAIQKRPVVIARGHAILPDPDDFIAIRPMVYLSFTFDHRILDGAGADGFLAAVKDFLENYTG